MILTLNDIKYLGEHLALYKPVDEIQSNFHTSMAPIRWLMGGNQSGKTHTNMIDLAQLVLNVHPTRIISKGLHWACIESWEQVRDILWADNLKKFIPKHHILHIRYGQERVPKRLILKNGHTIEFKAFNQGRGLFQGRAINSCYCDEQCLHDFDGIFREIQSRLVTLNGTLSWSMTPIVPQASLEDRILELPDTDEVFYADLNSNRKSRGGYVSDERVDALIAEWPDEIKETRIKGHFASFYGAVYKGFNRQIHVIPPMKIPDNWTLYRGFDFGFTNPFVCLWLAQDKDKNWYVYREYYKSKTGIHEHIKNVKAYSNNEKYLENFADPENAEDRAEMHKCGILTKKARKEVARGIETVQSKLKLKENGKPSLYIFNTCKNTIREMSIYSYPKGSKSRDPADHPLPKDERFYIVKIFKYYLWRLK